MVLIPSFSGRWLVEMIENIFGGLGLNPFFFRSLVGPPGSWKSAKAPSLNPFFFRSLVGRSLSSNVPPQNVLIPSFSGRWLVRRFPVSSPTRLGLNPFFFRSLVGPGSPNDQRTADGLNPFFFRSLVGPQIGRKTRGQLCLNPFFFRSLVGLAGKHWPGVIRGS